jgi:hypothetical protein
MNNLNFLSIAIQTECRQSFTVAYVVFIAPISSGPLFHEIRVQLG